MEHLVARLYQTSKNILTVKDLALIWGEGNRDRLKDKIFYYVKTGLLFRITRGIFAKNRDYNPKELATSLYTPSYISFETVLRESGMIFQHYDSLFVASHWSRSVELDGHRFTIRKLKNEVLYNPTGIIQQEGFSIAEKERAFLDMIYLFPAYYFDNLRPLDWEKCFEWVKLYQNRQLVKRLNTYHKNHAE